MYSSIEEANRKEVIDNCYWPLFRLVETGFPVGIEASGITLEIINKTNPSWIKTLSRFIKDEKVEFIGSGYSQVIGPLVPTKVNVWNQKLGLEVYDKLLSIAPQVALVNEMAYSAGIVEHYIDARYEAIVMEWNNPRKYHLEWDNKWRYYPQKAKGCGKQSITLIWADSIAFQKFQRYAHGENEIDEYVNYIKSHIGNNDRFFPLYCNDVEIFDYRPGRYNTEAQINRKNEWDRIFDLYNHLDQQDWCQLVFPSDVLYGLKKPKGSHELQLESPSQPIPVKKQEKYNINRWALTGRDDLGINTKCYQAYDGLVSNNNEKADDWKELCYLWSSDFRTHITEKRWVEYVSRLDDYNKKWMPQTENKKKGNPQKNDRPGITQDDRWLTVENAKYSIKFNKNKGLTFQELVCKDLCDKPLICKLDHGYYDDISLGADYYSGHAVIDRPGEYKVTDLGKLSPEIVVTDNDIKLKVDHEGGNYKFDNTVQINSEIIIIKKTIEVNTAEKAIIRPYNFTFNPEVWDQGSLYIETHNGGSSIVRFYLKNHKISHGDIYSSLISARHGFGNTEGIFRVGDKDKLMTFECKMSVSALIPSIIYKEMDGTYFFRLQYSAREMDETSKSQNSKFSLELSISISF